MIPLTLVLLGMTAVVVLGLLLPLLHRWHAPAARRQYDRAVYRAQLEELDRDVARGVIGGAEAQAARLEIERRLLAAAAAGDAQGLNLGAPTMRVRDSRALA
ncbi:MAG TPA: c-type cytochrome biogenesis protein CcmI, partial [Acetobacteraceae bacterium]|nr:c-type cytochrome biogenesis protein CcmI [Acetobacteraceae bacterium]